MWERDVYLDHGLLKHAELSFYEQLGPAGNTEKDPIRTRAAVTGIHSAARSIVNAFWITCVIFHRVPSGSGERRTPGG